MTKYLSPTAAWNAQADVHHASDEELESIPARQRFARVLRRFGPLLALMPVTNILVRQYFTLAGLEPRHPVQARLMSKALDAFRDLTGCDRDMTVQPLIEGYSYLGDIAASMKFYARAARGLAWDLPSRLYAEQVEVFRHMTGPTGHVYAQETRADARLTPSATPFYTCEAFTVCRRGGGLTLVHHDVRVRWWRFRWNFHVENTFGRVVHGPEDWTWYTGWPNKRVTFWWRLFPPKMVVLERNTERVVLQRGREWLEVVFGE